ncbi:hypothetical protein B9G55_14770 [Saccharibacillus sp. O16]|nr:hypothetical protein B9G55_14770 [Saccharibacillus sp. O16]
MLINFNLLYFIRKPRNTKGNSRKKIQFLSKKTKKTGLCLATFEQVYAFNERRLCLAASFFVIMRRAIITGFFVEEIRPKLD